MAQTVGVGSQAYAIYGYEASYGAGAVSARFFGEGNKITISRKNNLERVYGIGARNATTAVTKKYEGSVSMEFLLNNGSFFRAVLGSNADGEGEGPTYTHTYTEANTLPSFAIDTASELGTNDEVTELKGCQVSNMTLNASVGEVVRVTLDCPYQTETYATSTYTNPTLAAPYNDDPFTFVSGTLEFPSGTTIGNVQNVELTINNDLELIYGLGSRFSTAGLGKRREYNIRATVAFSDPTLLLMRFYNGTASASAPTSTSVAATATMVLTFTNSGAAGALRSIVITLANIYLDEETLPKDVNEVIKEDVTGWALSGTSIVWTNATSVDTGNP